MYRVSVAIIALFCASISTPLIAQTTGVTAETSQAAPVPQDLVQPNRIAPVPQDLIQPNQAAPLVNDLVPPDKTAPVAPEYVESQKKPGLISGFALDFLNDQKAIWTSPFHITGGDVKWLAPVVVAGGTLAIFDHKISDAAKANPSLQGPSNAISNVGLIAPWAVPGAMWVIGGVKHDDHAAETGRLGIEAAIDSEALMQVLKFVTQRTRPNLADNASFPSGHAMEAFALASVLSGEYPDKKLVVFGSYGLATAVSLSRIGGLNHFPTDVLAGAVMGELIGRYVVHHHAQQQLAQ